MRTRMHRSIAALALLLASTSAAAAQGKLEHTDFYVGFGLGPGWGRLGGDFADAGTESGLSGHLRFGWTVAPNLLVGFETDIWYQSADSLDNAWGTGMAAAYLYPIASLPAFLKGGVGWMYVNTNDGFSELTSNHVSMQAGVGYDIKLASNHAITLVANYIYGFSSGLALQDVHVGNASPSIIQVGVAYSLY